MKFLSKFWLEICMIILCIYVSVLIFIKFSLIAGIIACHFLSGLIAIIMQGRKKIFSLLTEAGLNLAFLWTLIGFATLIFGGYVTLLLALWMIPEKINNSKIRDRIRLDMQTSNA